MEAVMAGDAFRKLKPGRVSMFESGASRLTINAIEGSKEGGILFKIC